MSRDKPRSNLCVPLTTRAAAFSNRCNLSVVAFGAPARMALQLSMREATVNVQPEAERDNCGEKGRFVIAMSVYLFVMRSKMSKNTQVGLNELSVCKQLVSIFDFDSTAI